MELQHAALYLPPGSIPHIEARLIEAFSRLLPAFDEAVEVSEGRSSLRGVKMWGLLGIDTDFRLDEEHGLVPLVLEANVSGN
jgi:hypothetical protein